MNRISILYILIMAIVVSCGDGNNSDGPSEVSCNDASGLWDIRTITCDGSANTTFARTFFLFGSTGLTTQTDGDNDCSRTFTWDRIIGDETPTFNLTGTGNLSCSANGVSVASCSSAGATCNSLVDVTGIRNNYTTCVIRSNIMYLERTVSAINNPDNLAYCNNGQAEVVTLQQATEVDLDPVLDPDDPNPRAILRVLGPNPADFGSISVDTERTLTLSLTNSGNAAGTITRTEGIDPPFTFLGGNWPGNGGTCGLTIAANETCTFVVRFAPRASNSFADTIEIVYNDGVQSQLETHGVVGSGSNALAQLAISDGPFFDFTSVGVGTPSTHIFTITNSGGGAATSISIDGLATPFSFNGGSYPGTAGDCTTTLGVGASCSIEVEFLPTSTGPFNDIIELNYNDGVLLQNTNRNIFGAGI